MPPPAAPGKTPARRWRVLVVDDDRDFAESVEDILAMDRYEVNLAGGAEAATKVLADFDADVALIDIRLDRNSGVDLIGILRRQRPDLVCVMMTAYASAATAIEALDEGAYSYLRKPFHPNDLLTTLNRVFERLELERQKREAEDALRDSEQRFRNLIEGSAQGIYIHHDYTPLYVNRAFAKLLGYGSASEIMSMGSLRCHIAEHERARLAGILSARMAGRDAPTHYEYEARRKDDSIVTLQNSVRSVTWAGVEAVQCTVVDVTERYRTLRALRRYEHIVSSTADLMAFIDGDYRFQAVNRAYAGRYLKLPEDLVGMSMRVLHGVALFELQMRRALDRCLGGEEVHYQAWFDFPETGRRFMDVGHFPYREDADGGANVVMSWRDMTETHRLSEQLSYQATHDALTGLVNRVEFERRLERVMKTARTDESENALCYLDLDQFKVINDTCGHVAGDELLRQLGALLPNSVRKHDTFARLGGDEFGLLMEGCTPKQARRVANAILNAVRDFRFHWDDKAFQIGVSIGLVPIDPMSENVTSVLQAADTACYVAKDKGRNRVHVYRTDDAELARWHSEVRWVTRINEALEQDRLLLYCQPIVSVSDGENRPDHVELLLRMRDEDGSIVPPGAFFAAAERYNLTGGLDRWVIGRALSWIAEHPDAAAGLRMFSLNLSGHSLGNVELMDFVKRELERLRVSPEKICFEITETAAIANFTSAARFISTLKSIGCRFALDDFGSGLSSFAYLKNLPVDFLKIDGIFVKDILDDAIDEAMVRSINEIGHKMGKQTVAEFVEDEAVLVKLRQIGVDYAQGFAVGRPRPIEEMF